MRKEQIEKILLKRNILNEESMRKVEEEVRRTGLSFEKALEKMQILNEQELAQLIGEEIGVPFVDISSYLIDISVVKLIPQKLARKHKLVALFKIGNTLTLAMVNPKDVMALDEVRQATSMENIEAVLSTERMINKVIEDHYVEADEMESIIKGIGKKGQDATAGVEGAPIVRIVNLVFLEAVKARASDVHIEPQENSVMVRYRIDGVLHEVKNFPKHTQNAVSSRIKLLADMDIAESRLPQDGRISLKIENKSLDIRVSSFPTVYGENIVMRLLDKTSVILGLSELGFLKQEEEKFEELIRSPYGIILVTGPTGSGKTTTLYAVLTSINSMEKNIITIEDPVEYELPLIRQTQVNVKAGLTFANGLRSILRQDPDVIMVGESRDLETAEVATQAALTGHLVLTTLHTNDAPSAVTRLIDMGVEPFLVSSTVVGVLAQRLVRVICPKCRQKYSPSREEMKELGILEIKELYHGKGCRECKNTGFLGRVGIFELLLVDEEIKEMIVRKVSAEELRQKAVSKGMRTFYDDGIEKVAKGVTTIEEVLRVAKAA